ncbi:MBL fold metallo-hydrolase [Sulfurimonas sp. SWIR-19]|uniref:MBL fold metallo-hydrolase n=1 Tax=Sulfurimonas sp. SWIR-19 TaxID=2878390 RepID=UPI0021068ED6|nr:MBL fold metallo-hydrolase [Sulfurimonas sp. SWIR-19]
MSNSCFVTLGNSYLVIDSGPTYQYAQQAYQKMKTIKNLPVSYVIDTHVHDDHWLGNSYYATLGSTIIGSSVFKELPKLEKTRMQRRISPEAYEQTKQIFPTVFVDQEKVLDINGTKVYIKSVNHKAHTNSDLYVYIPSKKIVFVGDLVFNQRLPSLRDGDISGWIQALDDIRKMDVEYIVGGHGENIDKKAVDFTYNYLKTLKKEVKKRLDAGEDIADVVNEVTMKEYKHDPFYDSIHRQNVETAYRMLEWEDE